MAATSPTPPDAPPLRIRLDASDRLHARAEWTLEALLARAGVDAWSIVTDAAEACDVAWGPHGRIPHLPEAWEFRWDAEPDPIVDPLAAAFWWLARVEELDAPADAFDAHGRFRWSASAMSRREHPFCTPVDDIAAALLGMLPQAWSGRDTTDRPASDAPAFQLVLTHDIDLPRRWTRSGRRRAARAMRADLRRGRIASAARTALQLASSPFRPDPWTNARRIYELEQGEGARSTCYLLVGQHTPEDGDAAGHTEAYAYDVPLPGIGLHGSYTSSVEPGRVGAERDRLRELTGAEVLDHRFHYLRHRPVEAWPMLAAAGLRSDSSLGFAERPSFRAGTAHPFRAWDHGAESPLDLVVIPLAVMDASFDERYLDVRDPLERRRVVLEVVDAIRAVGGAASMLVHNDRLCWSGDDGWTELYRAVLRYVAEHGGRAVSAGEAADAYRARIAGRR